MGPFGLFPLFWPFSFLKAPPLCNFLSNQRSYLIHLIDKFVSSIQSLKFSARKGWYALYEGAAMVHHGWMIGLSRGYAFRDLSSFDRAKNEAIFNHVEVEFG